LTGNETPQGAFSAMAKKTALVAKEKLMTTVLVLSGGPKEPVNEKNGVFSAKKGQAGRTHR